MVKKTTNTKRRQAGAPLSSEAKKLLKEMKEEMQRHTGILSEEFQWRLSAVAEQVGSIDRKTDILTEHAAALTENLNMLTIRVDVLTGRVDALAQEMSALIAQVGALTQAVEDMKSETSSLKRGFEKKIEYDEFLALEQRVRMLEKSRT